jgi:hypothetical protein
MLCHGIAPSKILKHKRESRKNTMQHYFLFFKGDTQLFQGTYFTSFHGETTSGKW